MEEIQGKDGFVEYVTSSFKIEGEVESGEIYRAEAEFKQCRE